MNAGATWHDVCILNISSRGLGLQAASAPPRGAFLEIRRGFHVIVAQVMWSQEDRFGVKAQDLLPVHLLGNASDAPAPEQSRPAIVERRSAPRVRLAALERSRNAGRRLEYVFVTTLALLMAGFLATEMHAVMAAPIDRVTAALGTPL